MKNEKENVEMNAEENQQEKPNSRMKSMLALLGALGTRLNNPLPKRPVSKHQASKKGHKHAFSEKNRPSERRRRDVIPSNHDRVVAGRAARLGMTVMEYIATKCA